MKKINTTLLLGALLGFCACHFESFDERCAREARGIHGKAMPPENGPVHPYGQPHV